MRIYLFLLAAVLFAGCAQQGVLTGGEKDTTSPILLGSIPPSPATGVQGQRITFVFDEFIKTSATYGKEIFISPAPKTAPKITVVNKKLHVTFQEPLRDSTTYVISVRDVADFNAGNKQAVAFTGAYSTGATLDSACVRGWMLNPDSTPAANITVMLFSADSLRGDSILGKVPVYVGRTSEGGRFDLPYLHNGKYRIYGVSDADNTNSFSAGDDGLALAAQPQLTLGKRDTADSVVLYLFKPDQKPPMVKSAKWIGRYTLSVALNEGLVTNNLQISLSDTLGGDLADLTEYTFIPGKEPELLLHTYRNATQISQLRLLHLRDSTGNQADTTVRIVPGKTRTVKEPLLATPTYKAAAGGLVFYLPEWLDSIPRSQIVLIDTGKKVVPAFFRWDDYQASVSLKAIPPGGVKLQIPGALLPAISQGKDTTYRIALNFPSAEQFGSVQGQVLTPGYDGPVVVSLTIPSKRGADPTEFISYSRKFNFSMVPPGKYKIQIIKDIDQSRTWTPGSLSPYRLPEAIRYGKTEVEVKANWELEDLEISW